MIQTEKLAKVFRTTEVETTALNDLSIQVDAGEFIALMGPSGCGKSTLLHILGLIDVPTSGSYRFLGEEVVGCSVAELARLRKANLGFIFQSFNLIDELTVFENVELPLKYNDVPAIERKQRVEAVLEKMNVAHRRNHFPVQLSGGQQQRVAVARAVVTAPRMILADEPTGNLDSEHGEDVMKVLHKLNEEGSTIFMVTHSQRDAAYSKRLIRMFDGRITQG
ncbi:ABC transporter ATP-binding protein [Povalibacter sp.]|uniref:ABC transporter ATP-binding protein n=1 Tax=Povalibacter sp. TaxID=1962978 RepID=UPI0032C21EF0